MARWRPRRRLPDEGRRGAVLFRADRARREGAGRGAPVHALDAPRGAGAADHRLDQDRARARATRRTLRPYVCDVTQLWEDAMTYHPDRRTLLTTGAAA